MGKKKTGYFPTGTVLNEKWVILEFIGKGAMGEVYRAHQTNLNRDVAIKIILPELLEELDDDELIEATISRFRREVQSLAQLRHPNVLQVYDHGTRLTDQTGKEFEIDFFVMEYVPGTTFRYVMSEDGFYPSKDAEMRTKIWIRRPFLKLLEGVQALHENGITHRDLKPENILMDNDTPKIADFGLVRWVRSKPVTDSMESYGTAAYMPPEQFMDYKYADRRADVYALGKILYEAIRGKLGKETVPFKQARIESPDTPFFKGIDTVIQKATAEDREDRYDSVRDLTDALEELIVNDTKKRSGKVTDEASALTQKSPLILAGVIVAILSVSGMTIWHLLGEPGLRHPESSITTTNSVQKNRENIIGDSKENHFQNSESIPGTLMGGDGINMNLITGGEYKTEAGSSIHIDPFYLDTSFVTNHHFADFLNDMRQYLVVEQGVVKNDGHILLYVGNHQQANENIIYKHGRFHLKDVSMAASPIVQVTWYGAVEYARHYRKRLPTEIEWQYAVGTGQYQIRISNEDSSGQTSSSPDTATDAGMGHMMHMETTDGNDSNEPGEESSADPYSVLRIWGVSELSSDREDIDEFEKAVAANSTIMITTSNGEVSASEMSDPVEVFSEVGFVCVLDVMDM